MVGVPGRSRACSTCKIRKRRCDYQVPSCARCVRAGIECGGYERQMIFLNNTTERGVTGRQVAYSRSAAHQTRGQLVGTIDPANVILPDSLPRSAYQSRYMGLFWDAFLPNGQRFTPTSMNLATVEWASVVQETCHTDNLLKFALLANCLCILGARDKQDWMVVEGMKAYGNVLRYMASTMEVVSMAKRDSVLAASRMLALFEILFGSDNQHRTLQSENYAKHQAGELALILSREPVEYSRGDAHRLFIDCRFTTAVYGIQWRKRSPLADVPWMEDPWQVTPKKPKDYLLDITIQIPGLLEDLDVARSLLDPQNRTVAVQQVLATCGKLDDALVVWAQKMNPHIPLEEALVEQSETRIGERVAALHLPMIYWTNCLLVYSTSRLLTPHHELETLPARLKLRQYCQMIIKGAQIMFGVHSGWIGQTMAAFPLGVALQVLLATERPEEPSEERSAVLSLLRRRGREIGKLYVSLGKDHPTYATCYAKSK